MRHTINRSGYKSGGFICRLYTIPKNGLLRQVYIILCVKETIRPQLCNEVKEKKFSSHTHSR